MLSGFISVLSCFMPFKIRNRQSRRPKLTDIVVTRPADMFPRRRNGDVGLAHPGSTENSKGV